MSKHTPPESEFYVNYFPVPARLKLSLRRAIPIALWVMALIAGAAALAMHHPGHGTWNADEVALEGLVVSNPWPALRIREADGRTATVLLVEYGKLGADRAIQAAGVAGRLARIHGTLIQRDGRRIMELAPRAGAIEPLQSSPAAQAAPAPLAWTVQTGPRITIEGEIVDPKCYLGAMRPGQGQVHRACARVCIAGGIPAGLISPAAPNADGSRAPERFCLLLDESGTPLGTRTLEWVGRPVRITGTLEWWDDLLVLRVAQDSIQPL